MIESFRNDMWPGYKSSAGMPPELLAQFPLVEDALRALGVVVWPMIDVEADDGLAAAAATAAADPRVDQVVIMTPDKDLAQCVDDDRVVQLDRRSGVLSNTDGVVKRFGVRPESIPDFLALVGDSSDGFPGLKGWGSKSAAAVLYPLHPPRGHPPRSLAMGCRCPRRDPARGDSERAARPRLAVPRPRDAADRACAVHQRRRTSLDGPGAGVRCDL